MSVKRVLTHHHTSSVTAKYLTLFDMGFFEPSVMGGPKAPHQSFVVIATMITKFGTGINLDVFYTMVTKNFVTSLLLRNYDVMNCILADT